MSPKLHRAICLAASVIVTGLALVFPKAAPFIAIAAPFLAGWGIVLPPPVKP